MAEKTIQSPQGQHTDKAMDKRVQKRVGAPPIMQAARKMPEVPQIRDQTVEVAREIPQERIKPAGDSASVRERVRQFEMNGGVSRTSTVEAPRVGPDGRQSEDPEDEAPNKRRKQESDPDSRAPVHFSLCDDSNDQGTKSVSESAELHASKRSEGERKGQLSVKLDDVMVKMRDVRSEILQVRELVGVLVHRERCAETKAEIATRRLTRMEKERDEESEAECEATLEEALTNQSKVVKVIVDKWFVHKGFGFGKTPTGEIVFIHASAVQGAEVLKIGTDTRAQVVNGDARAQEGVSSQAGLGTRRMEG